MPSIFSKLKGMLCIPDSSKPHSEKAASRKPPPPPSAPKPAEDERRRSSDTCSSASSSDSKRSDQVLEVLKAFNLKNIKTVADVAMIGVDGEPVDDKTYLMERIIQLAADLPVTSRTSATLTNAFLNQLWTDLQHPPQSYLGTEYIYRKADGSNNNILWPHLGAAGQPYARTVRPRRMQPIDRPDPGLVFDSLLVRKEFQPHPNKISSVLFYVASIIIHDIFHTNHEDYSISDTSSYLDLAPLYGSSQKEQESVRAMRDGMLKPDCFADVRILGFPPGVGVLLIMFNRFHNHVAETLALIDENGRFSRILNPQGTPKPPNAQALYDEALFQTARLVTTGLYVNIILKDYVRTILNLNRVDSLWNLDPRSEEGKAIFGHKIPEATGNSVSAEFNLVYRWHACVSERDEQWTKDVYTTLFGDYPTQSLGAFLSALDGWAKTLSSDPLKREFAGLSRLPNNKFPDEKLAAIWTASVSDIAGSYGAGHVPAIFKNVEILGIIQSRSWNLASLNEFREYFKLQPHETFKDINPDPIIAEQLRRLYGHPDNVEIYPGVIVEAAKESKLPGSGLCTNFTTSRAILSDAVALVRGDRFYTVDYTPANLTNWGFNEASYDLSINYGCVFYKLVLNAFPNSYRPNSIYAHYPLVIPEENKVILTGLKKADRYNFDKPMDLPAPAIFKSVEACRAVANDTSAFHSTWEPLAFSSGYGLQKSREQAPILAQKLMEHEGLQSAAATFYKDTIASLVKSESYQVGGTRQVDVIRDVFNVAHARFVANVFFLPLGSNGKGRNKYDEFDIITLLSAVYACTSPEQSSAHRFVIMKKKQRGIRQLAEHVQEDVDGLIRGNFGLHSHSTVQLRSYATQAIQAVSKSGLSPTEIVWSQILPLAARIFVTQSRASAEGIDYLFGGGQAKFQDLQELPRTGTTSSGKFQSCVDDICRILPSTPLFRQAASSKIIVDEGRQVELFPGQIVLCEACRQTAVTGDGGTTSEANGPVAVEISLGAQLGKAIVSAMLEVLCQLHKVSRPAGATGRLRRLRQDNTITYLNVEESTSIPHPSSMKVNWQE
ncbi:uncharacterized protein Z518_08058 [Rhinocladiella mackenziei CBS 650.93]|uniref:Linoleate 8R-lipoxygenase n=1 Tax=Rhinocladiella mackenziei CBS 650.93 TaxID=1442369 RepID=A0A0D2I8D2_9EURO|nr:uncharacterized protein Z518_08058 [Rhinocladiella mackenziei CBS 650.93]KIX02119.1 hypothetical protein Z518_08058 [Rhinocladiella mackenziei CBS 650.93]